MKIEKEYKAGMADLKKARIAAGLTQKQAAELCGVPLRSLQNWEQGRYNPPEYVKQSILNKLKEEGN